MTETRDAFGPLLERLQVDMRILKAEQAALKTFVAELVEAMGDALGDRIERRLDQTERSIEERLTALEASLKRQPQ